MAKEFYKDELDSFLQQKADDYTMRPSEKVWKGIRKNLFWQRNWFSITGSSVLALCLLFLLPDSFLSTFFYNAAKSSGKLTKGGSSTAMLSSHSSNNLKAIPGGSTSLSGDRSVPAAGQYNLSVHTGNPVRSGAASTKQLSNATLSSRPVAMLRNIAEITPSSALPLAAPAEPRAKNADHALEAAGAAAQEAPEQYHGDLNWLQELALIKLTPPKKSRVNLQFYFSPMISYRTLTDNGNNTHNPTGSGPMAASQFDINQYVDHQPSIGVELGSNMLFKAGNNLTFKGGLQLNYSRYTIKAYKVGYEKASIALNSFGRGADTITNYTTIRNINGYLQEQLQNQYLQLSIPIGAELKLLGNKRFQLNIAGTIQPTYLLLNDAYLLSTDYINYTKEPSLVRRWNVHSSAEAYISYQFANVRWQVGPQFRYQLLSSFTDRYPIKEYLMEYGIKFGISKTLK